MDIDVSTTKSHRANGSANPADGKRTAATHTKQKIKTGLQFNILMIFAG